MRKWERATIGMSVAVILGGAVQSASFGAAFTPGDIVVTRAIGGAVDPSATPGSVAPIQTSTALGGWGDAATVELDEYTPGGTLVQSIQLPNVKQTSTAAGTSYALTFSGTQNNEGTITVSGDGRYFTIAGYNQTAGFGDSGNPSTSNQTSDVDQRVVGLIGMDGSVNTTTGLTDVSSKQSIRSAYTTNGTDLWVGGSSGGTLTNGAVTAGVHYAQLGATTSTQLTNGRTEQRILNGFNLDGNGLQLYLSSDATTSQTTSTIFRGIATVGTGMPITAPATMPDPVQMPGFDAASFNGIKADNYWFKDANTVYMTDQRNDGNGGVVKLELQSGAWTPVETLHFPAGTTGNVVGGHGLSAGTVDPTTGDVTLFATTFDGTGANATQVYQVVDDGTSLTGTLVATSAANSAFRGVAVVPTAAPVPEPASLAMLGIGAAALMARRRRA